MSIPAIQQAAYARLASVAGSYPVVGWNVDYDPPADTPYFRMDPVGEASRTLTLSGLSRVVGDIYVYAAAPLETGAVHTAAMVAKVIEAFPVNQAINAGRVTDYPTARPALFTATEYRVPILIRFAAYL